MAPGEARVVHGSARIMPQRAEVTQRGPVLRFDILRRHPVRHPHGIRKLMTTFDRVRQIVGESLELGERTSTLGPETALLGNIPEFDSLAVLGVITALEKSFGIQFEDDDITGETFETLGNLAAFVQAKL
jgi:acyl carrier protein